MSRKRTFFIFLAMVILVAIGVAVYYFFFYTKPGEQPSAPQQQVGEFPTGENVAVIQERLARISTGEVVSPTSSADGTKVLYLGKQRGIYESGFDGADLKEKPFAAQQNLHNVLWSADRNGIIATYTNADGRKLFYYDLSQTTATPYAPDVRWVSFEKNGAGIAYHQLDELAGVNAIAVARADGSSAQTVFPTRLKDVRLEFLAGGTIALWTAPSGFVESTLWSLDPATRKLSPVLANITGLTIAWSPDGEVLLYSQTAGGGKNLSLYAAAKDGTNVQQLGIATLPEKCAFANDATSVVCAVPKTLPADLVWTDDYYKKLYTATEELWQINVRTGAQNKLFEFPSSSFDATDLLLSPDDAALVFVNRKDGYLYSVKLTE
mgnify:FL=1